MDKKNIKKAGFSLIELLFAMLFLSIIVFGVIKLQTSNLTLSNTKQLELKAYSYAAQGLEIVDALGATAIKNNCTVELCYLDKPMSAYLIKNEGYEDPAVGGAEAGLFKRTFVHDVTDLTDATLVTMTVAWEDSSGLHSASAKRIILN